MIWHFQQPMVVATVLASLTWADASSLLAVLTPLVAVPLGAMTFYLRSIREQQLSGHADLTRRLEYVEGELSRLVRRVSNNERDFTTKEDWLRESMLTRQNLDRLTKAFARMEAAMDRIPPTTTDDTRRPSHVTGPTSVPSGTSRPQQERH